MIYVEERRCVQTVESEGRGAIIGDVSMPEDLRLAQSTEHGIVFYCSVECCPQKATSA